MEKANVVIVGAGIGGVRAAQELAGKRNVHVTLLDRNNYQLFPPLLYQVSTATLATGEIAYPVREFFRSCRNVDFRLGEVTGVDVKAREVVTEHGRVPYDYLVLAAGSTTNFFGNEEVARHAFPMKTMEEALAIRNQLIRCLELAEQETDAAQGAADVCLRRWRADRRRGGGRYLGAHLSVHAQGLSSPRFL